jgi:copper chaperone CopZ
VAVERVEGVREAEFAYPEGTGTVVYDTTVTSDSAIIAALARATGFGATVKPARSVQGKH